MSSAASSSTCTTFRPITRCRRPRLLVGSFQRTTPFLYTDREIAALMSAAAALTGTIRPHAYRTLIGLIAVTGMRISEVLALNDTDVDLDDGLLTIRNTKFGKSRRLPIHNTTVLALRAYVDPAPGPGR